MTLYFFKISKNEEDKFKTTLKKCNHIWENIKMRTYEDIEDCLIDNILIGYDNNNIIKIICLYEYNNKRIDIYNFTISKNVKNYKAEEQNIFRNIINEFKREGVNKFILHKI